MLQVAVSNANSLECLSMQPEGAFMILGYKMGGVFIVCKCGWGLVNSPA